MAILGIPRRNGEMTGQIGENEIHYKKKNYTNLDAVNNLIRYVTRTRENEDRAGDLIAFGAVGADYSHSVDDMIQQFLYVQNVNGINSRGGRRMYHEVFNLLDWEAERLANSPEWLWNVGMECSRIYYQMGHQAVFGVHWEPEKRCHIHFAVNTINFTDGRKWHTSMPEIKEREAVFNEILRRYQIMATGAIEPLIFLNESKVSVDA